MEKKCDFRQSVAGLKLKICKKVCKIMQNSILSRRERNRKFHHFVLGENNTKFVNRPREHNYFNVTDWWNSRYFWRLLNKILYFRNHLTKFTIFFSRPIDKIRYWFLQSFDKTSDFFFLHILFEFGCLFLRSFHEFCEFSPWHHLKNFFIICRSVCWDSQYMLLNGGILDF